KRRTCREAGVVTENPGQLPTADEQVGNPIHLAKELLAIANRQCPDIVRVDQVAHIEARIATIDLEVERIEDGHARDADGGFTGRSQIQRMAERVVKIELQVFGEPLPEVDLRRMII